MGGCGNDIQSLFEHERIIVKLSKPLAALVAAGMLALAGCGQSVADAEEPTPEQTPAQTPAQDPTPSAESTPSNSPTPQAPAVSDSTDYQVNQSFTDPQMQVDTTVKEVKGPLPASEQLAAPETGWDATLTSGLFGVYLSVDASKTEFYSTFNESDFKIVKGDKDVDCLGMTTKRQAAIEAMLGGPKFENNFNESVSEGWIVCYVTVLKADDFASGPYDLVYTREGGTTTDGEVVPEFTHTVTFG
jgi:hypothetical protein